MPNRTDPSSSLPTSAPPTGRARDLVDEDEIRAILTDAYVYAYPLVLMDVTRRTMTNVASTEAGGGMLAPINQFAHAPAFPNADFTAVVRPNADTLYSSLWFDVSREPLVVDVADSGGRYYLLPMLDAWTDVFAAPGKRTTGTEAQTFAIVGPGFQGKLPADLDVVRAPTNIGWMIGRTQTNGASDYDAVHEFQAGLRAVPLAAWGHYYEPPLGKVDPSVPTRAPPDQVAAMDGASFFGRFLDLLPSNPPHANDYPILARLARIGVVPGKPFDPGSLSSKARKALDSAAAEALANITAEVSSRRVNGWTMIDSPIGTYGTDYLRRAAIAYAGLGANRIEDATYPTAYDDSEGRPFDSSKRYVLHFDAGELPPARAFWSLTVYDERQLFAANPIDRYAIGDRDDLAFGPDGSLDLFIQREAPSDARAAKNWLPAPARGGFTMNLRLYWPKPAMLEGRWTPPPVRRID